MFPQPAIGALQTRKILVARGSQSARTAAQGGSADLVLSSAATGSQSSKAAKQSGKASSATPPNVNDKIIAYWKFDGTANRVYDGSNSADFIIDEVSDPSLDLALQTTVSSFDSSGLINNCLPVFGEAQLSSIYNNVLTAINPVTNGFGFIGIGMWIKIKDNLALDPSFTGTTYESLICDFGNRIKVIARVISNDPFEYQIEFVNGFASSYSNIIFNIAADYWVFIRAEVDRSALTFTFRFNDFADFSFPYTEGYTDLTYAAIGSNDIVEFLIDESFAYSSPLSGGELTQVFNSGSGDTYPF
jgi:hypothetical protein